MRQWIAGVTAASVLAAMAMALTPKGSVKQVTRLVCGLMCALAVAAPVVKLDLGSLSAGIAKYEQRAREITSQAEEEEKMLDRTYIEDRCRAYILSKAASLGAHVQDAVVTARWDNEDTVWYPWTVVVSGGYDRALAAAIEGELGIPADRQEWLTDG